jgi:hypothetical protein
MMKIYNFDEIIERRGTNCVKYDLLGKLFGNKDALPLWVADMDFKTPDFIMQALEERMHNFASKTVETVGKVEGLLAFGMTVSPDSRYVLYSLYGPDRSDLMMVEGYRP